jgi:hypothetical protein
MAYGTINVDQIGTSVAGSNLGAGDASLMKNRIINGAMVIDQRNNGAAINPVANNQFITDRFLFQSSQASKFNAGQNLGSVTPPAGFTNYLGFSSTSAYSITSTDYFMVMQNIEGFNFADLAWGTANAKTVTLSFQVYSSLTGTFGGTIRTGISTQQYYPFTYSVSAANTWTQISVTIAGPTSGNMNTTNGVAIAVIFGLGVGSAKSGTAGSWGTTEALSATGAVSVVGTNGATWYVTGVQLEVGSIATGYEYRQYGQELALCQRYFETGNYRQYGATNSVGYIGGTVSFKNTKRTSPTISVSGQWGTSTATAAADTISVDAVMFSSGSAGAAANISAIFTASAEL